MKYYVYKPVILNFLFVCIIVASTLVFWYYYFKAGEPYEMPLFNTQAELDASPWGNYIEDIYKNKPTGVSGDYPLDLTDFTVLYKTELNNNGIYVPDKIVTNACSNLTANNIPSTLLSSWTRFDGPKYWLNKLKPFNCIPDDTYTEVIHSEGDPVGIGTWMYNVKGSGIWYDVGTTICFRDHKQAVAHYLPGVTCSNGACDEQLSALATAVADDGKTSIQFTHHGDQWCGVRAIEIVHVLGEGQYNCGFNPTTGGASIATTYKTGWSQGISCVCDSSKQMLNCNDS